MANICCDDVYFYSDSNPEGLRLLWEDLETSIILCPDADAAWIGNLFRDKNLVTEGIGLRGTVNYMEKEQNHILLCTDAAWNPLYNAYQAIAAAYQVDFAMLSIECGENLYYNTDSTGTYFPDKYILTFDDGKTVTPNGKILEQVVAYGEMFTTDQSLLQKFRAIGYAADNLPELIKQVEADEISIHEFINPYDNDCDSRKVDAA